MFYPCALTLLDINTDSSAAPASTIKTWEITSPVNDVRTLASFCITKLAQTGGASTPAAQLKVELSPDNVHWFPAGDVGLTTSAGDPDAETIVNDFAVLRYVRCTLTVSGGTRPGVVAQVIIPTNLTLEARLLA